MDHFKGLYNDPYAIRRIISSIGLLSAKNGNSVLDVGCYEQLAREFLKGCDYLGIDTAKFTPDVILKNIDGGFLLSQKFDRIICLEVLEHLIYPSGTLNSIRCHLKLGGICVVSTPNEATLFHRIRGLFGTMDAEAWKNHCKHLHLPNLKQTRKFLKEYFDIEKEIYYINPSAIGSRQAWLGKALSLIPDIIWQILANLRPTLFARGFIFKLRLKSR